MGRCSLPVSLFLEEVDFLKHYCSDVDAVLEELGSSSEGLSSEEAALRLERDGQNKLKDPVKESLLKRFLKQLADPMIIVLIAAALVSAGVSIFAHEGFADVIIILAVVIVNAVLGVYQEQKAERAIEALQEMSAARTRVLRDGRPKEIPSLELCVGDIILLEAGDSVPADARLLEAAGLKTEEAALTGESLPVTKQTGALKEDGEGHAVPLGDRKNMVYTGSSVVYGRGKAAVTAIGMGTEMGKIAEAIANTKEMQTPLQKKLGQLSRFLTKLVLGICVIIFAVQIIRAGGFSVGTVLDAFMISVSLAVAAIPEGLVAVVTLVLSVGVTRMSKRNAIIRRLTAVETLGCSQVICSDKTGTLTLNKMTVVDSYGTDTKLLATCMSLCSDADEDENGIAVGEPTECALVNFAHDMDLPKGTLKESQPRVGEAPFDSVRKLMTTLHKSEKGIIQYTKGAPDVLLDRCTSFYDNGEIIPMTEEKRSEILSVNKSMADRALRVLAGAIVFRDEMPENTEPSNIEHDLCFLGLCAMIDPVRPEVKKAIEVSRAAGIRPIMITGDHIDTAVAIAKELGILDENTRAIEGKVLDRMDDETYAREFREISVYARVQPEHKTRIVRQWQDEGCVTAMTGDGVNDAPSIKAADIGVGMGITGTDVTKNVADMVLADDNFATIVGAVEEGRRIYDNIRKAIQFLLGSNISEVISIFVATIMGFTILKPVHLLWINLVTDSFPALALGMEDAESGIMQRPPRGSNEGVFFGGIKFDIGYQGFFIAALTIASYFVGHFLESGVWEIAESAHGMTMAFITMSFAEIFHSFNMRSLRGSLFSLKTVNSALLKAGLASIISTTAVCEISVLANMFGFTKVSLSEYAIAVGFSVCIIPIVEIVKLIQRASDKKSAAKVSAAPAVSEKAEDTNDNK
ncbi:MAG: cation-translocating P-type ATPase [Ruminococcaceae bacterium]|nr:cation-translocating P-type ATPase [Oscillospiraceae bacterium]